jgi:hypothetical protein
MSIHLLRGIPQKYGKYLNFQAFYLFFGAVAVANLNLSFLKNAIG